MCCIVKLFLYCSSKINNLYNQQYDYNNCHIVNDKIDIGTKQLTDKMPKIGTKIANVVENR